MYIFPTGCSKQVCKGALKHWHYVANPTQLAVMFPWKGTEGNPVVGGGLIGYVKNKPLGNGQIISIDVLVIVMIIAVFHKKLI